MSLTFSAASGSTISLCLSLSLIHICEILVELVDYIKVYENGNISVKFKFADELRKIAEYIEINTTEDTAVAG